MEKCLMEIFNDPVIKGFGAGIIICLLMIVAIALQETKRHNKLYKNIKDFFENFNSK